MVNLSKILQSERQLSEIGDAVGVNERKWFVAIVNNNTELSSSRKLENLGYETFVPLQEIVSESNGKRRKRNRVVIPSMLFVHVTEQERKQIVNLSFIKRFLTDIAGSKDALGKHPLAIIPDEQLQQLRTILIHSESYVYIESMPKSIGDRVEIVKGDLRGLKGYVTGFSDDHSYFYIQLNALGCARLLIDTSIVKCIRQ